MWSRASDARIQTRAAHYSTRHLGKSFFDPVTLRHKDFRSVLAQHSLLMYTENDQDSDQVTDQDTLEETTVVGNTDQLSPKTFSPSVEKVLAVMGSETLSALEIMERLHLVHRLTFRKNYLHLALQEGALEMTIPEKPQSRNQRYRKKR